MTSTIQSFGHVSMVPEPDHKPASPLPSAAQAAPSDEAAHMDSVTLSAAAQANATLVKAAQQAEGVDRSAVSAIKAALANGSYNVSPDDLANAISVVLHETWR